MVTILYQCDICDSVSQNEETIKECEKKCIAKKVGDDKTCRNCKYSFLKSINNSNAFKLCCIRKNEQEVLSNYCCINWKYDI